MKPPITEKRRNKVKYLTWNFIRQKFMKTTSMPNSVESPVYMKCYSSSSPWPVKSPSNSIRHDCQNICSWSRWPKTILEIRKSPNFSRWSTILYKFFKDLNNYRKMTNRAVVFSSRPFPNTLYKDHQWELPTIWKTRLFQKHVEQFR